MIVRYNLFFPAFTVGYILTGTDDFSGEDLVHPGGLGARRSPPQGRGQGRDGRGTQPCACQADQERKRQEVETQSLSTVQYSCIMCRQGPSTPPPPTPTANPPSTSALLHVAQTDHNMFLGERILSYLSLFISPSIYLLRFDVCL